MERELTHAVDLAGPDGRLRPEARGWARHPLHRCNLPRALPRVARWNYWGIFSRDAALTLLVADVGYVGGVLVSFQDFAARRPVERVYVHPRGLPVPLPDTADGDFVLDVRRLRLAMQQRGEALHVASEARTLFGQRLAVDLVIERPRHHETINVLVPWDDDHFQFTSKQQALPVRGEIRVGDTRYRFGPDNQAFACLDFGRGRWPSRIEWNWAFGAAARGGRTVGLNLGGTWTDGTGVTENGVVIDGRLHKIADAVDFRFDRRDFMAPWEIRTRGGGRVDLRFVPRRRRTVKVPIGLVHVELQQLVGSFTGTVIDDAGAPIAIDDMVGQAEWVRARI
jgi:hypothetical protein